MSNPVAPWRQRKFLAPQYWPAWLGLGLGWCCAQLPYRIQLWLGASLGMLGYALMKKRRKITLTNIELCFPELNTQQQQALVKKNFRSSGTALLETLLAWWGSERRMKKLLQHVEGLEHLQQALQQGKGVILLSAHLTCLEIGGRLLALHQPFAVMYKRTRNPLMETVIQHSRETHFQKAIPHHDMRAMVRSLKQNLVCWYAPDQDFGDQHSVFAPFMGVSTATLIATSRLARMSGAAVVPFFQRRLEDGSGYALSILPPLEQFPSGDDVADATRINHIIEQQIRTAPDQYLWMHKRFKTRPPGETDIY
jgi:KDO2-lipid IV(A) lauroyltransferase